MDVNAQKTAKLIKKAQNAKNEETRSKALAELWGIFGDRVRRKNQFGKAFLVFRNAVLTFDPGLGVPFLAYVAQKANWALASERRNKIKLESREIPCDDIPERFQDRENVDVEAECFRKDAILAIKRVANTERRLAAYFNACQEVCEAGFDCSDAEVARHMGCTRASIGLYRKKLVRLLAERGLDFESLAVVNA